MSALTDYVTRHMDTLDKLIASNADEVARIPPGLDRYGKSLEPRAYAPHIEDVTRRVATLLEVPHHRHTGFEIVSSDPRRIIPGAIFGGLFFGGLALSSRWEDGLTPEDILFTGGMGLVGAVVVIAKWWQSTQESYHSQIEGVIRIQSDRRISLISKSAHEYAHHLQSLSLADFSRHPIASRPLMEGHARRTQLAIARVFATEENNPAFLIEVLETVGEELRAAREHCLALQGHRGTAAQWRAQMAVRINSLLPLALPYDIGVAALSIAEHLSGPEILPEILRGDFSSLS